MRLKTLKLLREYVKLRGTFFLLLTIIGEISFTLIIVFVGRAIDSLVQQDFQNFSLYLLIIFIFTFVEEISDFFRVWIKSIYRVSLSNQLRERVTFFLSHTKNPYDIERGGGIGSYLPWFIEEVERMSGVIFGLLSIISATIRVALLCFIFGFYNLYLLFIVFLLLSIYVLIPLFFKKQNQRFGEEFQTLERGEYLKSLDTFKALSTFLRNLKGLSFLKRMLGITHSFAQKNYKLFGKQEIFHNSISLVFYFLLSLLEVTNGVFVYYGYLPFSIFVVGTLFFGYSIGALNQIKDSRLLIHKDAFLFDRFEEVVIYEAPKPLPNFELLKISSLTFSSENKEIFSNFNLELKRGQKIAIIGESGSGKTTVARIICGFIDNYNGEIFWGETKFRDLSWSQLAKNISLLSSEPQIFEATLRENFTLFSPSATQEQIQDLLNFFNLEHFDLNSQISKKTLSKGEAQRIALIRTLLLKKEILILDESLSGLDKSLREKIESWLLANPQLTLINITHQLSMEEKYSQVIRLGS